MPVSAEDVVGLYHRRVRDLGPSLSKMREVVTMYEGDTIVPLPELDEHEQPSVANLLTQGIDQLGQRLSSRLPDVSFPPLRPGIGLSEQKAHDRRKAILARWDMNQMTKKAGRRSRFLIGFGCAPVVVKPAGPGFHSKREMPYWHILSPLHTFPAPMSDPDDIEPEWVITSRTQTFSWLRARYPEIASVLFRGKKCTPETRFELLEYNDAEETVLVVKGQAREASTYYDGSEGSMACAVLERAINKAGMCLAVVPGRITLGRLQGHFDSIMHMFVSQSKLAAYEMIAISRSIFPELWVVSHPNSPSSARIVQVADGRQGVVGEIENGTIIPVSVQPGPQVGQAIDRLERAQRVEAGIPSDWGGESATNIRTAKRGEQVSSSTSDPVLGELQNILAEAMEAENVRAIAVERAYWGSKMTSFYLPRNGRVVSNDYRPNDLWETDFHYVKFSLPGVDAAGIPIELGQRTGTGQLSMQTSREIDPLVEDPEHERDQVELEALRGALLKGMEAQAQNGMLDPHEIAMIAQLKRAGDKELEECVIEVQASLQKKQAALANSQPGAPETQPGLAQAAPPGAPRPGAQGPPPLDQLLQRLRGPSKQSPAEQQLGGPGPVPPTPPGP